MIPSIAPRYKVFRSKIAIGGPQEFIKVFQDGVYILVLPAQSLMES